MQDQRACVEPQMFDLNTLCERAVHLSCEDGYHFGYAELNHVPDRCEACAADGVESRLVLAVATAAR